MILSSNKSDISELIGRIITLSKLYSTDKRFLETCNISNHSFLTDLKMGRNKNPGVGDIAKIVRGTGCNGSWLLADHGPMFFSDTSYMDEPDTKSVKEEFNSLEEELNAMRIEINQCVEELAEIIKAYHKAIRAKNIDMEQKIMLLNGFKHRLSHISNKYS